jgi:aminoglycoside 2'-N-acetyltransferase I
MEEHPLNLQLARVSDLSPEERADLRALSVAVYPPGEWADWAGRDIEWSDAEWCVCIRDEHGALVSYTGIVMRDAAVDGRAARIGGVGGIKTHPSARGRGYARLGVEKALEFFREQPEVEFALLVCEPHLIAYYAALGWVEFEGRLLVRQREVVETFTFNRVMTHAIRSDGPATGTIDLNGPPW